MNKKITEEITGAVMDTLCNAMASHNIGYNEDLHEALTLELDNMAEAAYRQCLGKIF